jgi:hypothetical protein
MGHDAAHGWLLDGDPAVAWQTLRDLLDASETDQETQRSRISHEGWGAEVLRRQLPTGDWGGRDTPDDAWRYNLTALEMLRLLEVDPRDPAIAQRIEATRDRVHWPDRFGGPAYFDGEEEPCINGQVLAQGAAFGVPSSTLVDRLLSEQLEDGGWNCDAPSSRRGSFHTTICVLEGLLAHERHVEASPSITAARERGEQYLVERGLMRRASDGELIDDRFFRFGWPSRWRYDVLRALDHLRAAGWDHDPRLDEALEAVRARQQDNGRWITEAPPLDIPLPFFEPTGTESRMITLRALRVLKHFGADA